MKIELLGKINKEERARIISAAGSLSRTPGTVFSVYESKNDYNSNIKIIKNIIGMGHKSITEHDYYVFGLQDVTPIIEQIIIGYRLSSFTIKSRREVDFRKVGFYIPTFHDLSGNVSQENDALLKIYKDHMNFLFDSYGILVEKGIHVEDARYILPYSYHSNIIMGMDARELERLTADLLYGNVSHIDEVRELGKQLEIIINHNIPYLSFNLKSVVDREEDILNQLRTHFQNEYLEPTHLLQPQLLKYTESADDHILQSMVMKRYQCTSEIALKMVSQLSLEAKTKYMRYLIENSSQRELEQISFQYQIPISLAVLTHLTRHRMQSLIVPNFTPLWDFNYYHIPNSIKKLNEQWYHEIYQKNQTIKNYFKEKGIRDEDLIYFYLSGQKSNVVTTINGSSLRWISSMRCCNKAQKEIRDIVNNMINQAKEVAPLYGDGLGATCDVFGYCGEKRESCGKIKQLKK